MAETTMNADIDLRRARMIAALLDWTESVDPCANGHVSHDAADHIGRRIVHSLSSHGFGADWDFDDVVEFIHGATWIDPAMDTPLPRSGHVRAKGADGHVMAFECRGKDG